MRTVGSVVPLTEIIGINWFLNSEVFRRLSFEKHCFGEKIGSQIKVLNPGAGAAAAGGSSAPTGRGARRPSGCAIGAADRLKEQEEAARVTKVKASLVLYDGVAEEDDELDLRCPEPVPHFRYGEPNALQLSTDGAHSSDREPSYRREVGVAGCSQRREVGIEKRVWLRLRGGGCR